MIRLRAASATDVGLVRAYNQDQALIASPLFAVADGMGGHAAGEVASALACEALGEAFAQAEIPSAEALRNAAQRANRAVFEQAQANPEMRGMGTTLVAIALTGDTDHQALAVVHVGDSRVYCQRQGELSQVTVDHSLVAELVAEGQIRAEDAERHPQRHVLSRALGVYPTVEVDLRVVEAVAGDRYLLCSDGLSREVSDDHIASVLRRLADPDEAAHELVELAKTRGGADNITVVIVDIVDSDVLNGDDADRQILDGGFAASATQAMPALGRNAAVPASETNAGRPDRGERRRAARAARGPRPRIVTVRSVAFVIALLALAGVAVGGIEWYGRSTYFVGLSGNHLVIYQGRPGGVLWIQPTVAVRTQVTRSQIEARHLSELAAGMVEPNLDAARRYVSNLVMEEQKAQGVTAP